MNRTGASLLSRQDCLRREVEHVQVQGHDAEASGRREVRVGGATFRMLEFSVARLIR